MITEGAMRLANSVVHRAFMDAELPTTSLVMLEKHQMLRHFAESRFLRMWCDVHEYDFDRVKNKLHYYLDESIKHWHEYYDSPLKNS